MADAAAPSSLPRSVILMIGPPRSGTTLIANSFMSHSRVSGVMEPYQRHRKTHETATDLAAFLAETRRIDLDRRPHLAVKETTTRQQNVDRSLALLHGAADQGIYTGLVVILRCPFSAFLSQVEASREMWSEKKMTAASKKSFRTWARIQRAGLKTLSDHARAQHVRVISYEAFCAAPASEMARLMALIPERLEPAAQLSFAPPDTIEVGGDPKTRMKSGRIALSDRSERIAELNARIGPCPERRFLTDLRKITLESACIEPDMVTLDRLSRLLA